MRTNVVIDDQLMKEAFKLWSSPGKQDWEGLQNIKKIPWYSDILFMV